ncbi:ERG2/sigma1 receptor-like protein [Tuber indicum]|nr:ERG2/sigma1 receptor-like protein [Tuber indicum]
MRVIAYLLALLPILYYSIDTILPRFFIFDPVRLQQLSQASIEKFPDNATLLMEDLQASLLAEYGDKHINGLRKDAWFFNNAGGAMGSMIILHASVTEYLILFGTPLGTEGHSGVHLAHDYFTILHGEQSVFYPGDIEPTVYKPGSQNHLPKGRAVQYILNGWALELAQGWIPSMLPFGFLDTFTSTLDFHNLWNTVYWTARGIVGQLLVGKF